MRRTRRRDAPAARLLEHSLTRFLAFSALGLGLDLSLLWLLDRLTGWPYPVSVTVAFVITYAVNFTLNRWFAFDAAHQPAGAQLRRFLPQVTADLVLVLFAVQVLTGLGLGLLLARTLSAGTNAVLNYCAYRWWTFRRASRRKDPDMTTTRRAGPR